MFGFSVKILRLRQTLIQTRNLYLPYVEPHILTERRVIIVANQARIPKCGP